MSEVLVNRLGGLSLPRKSVVRLTDRPDMTIDVYSGRKTTQQNNKFQLGYRYMYISLQTELGYSKCLNFLTTKRQTTKFSSTNFIKC